METPLKSQEILPAKVRYDQDYLDYADIVIGTKKRKKIKSYIELDWWMKAMQALDIAEKEIQMLRLIIRDYKKPES